MRRSLRSWLIIFITLALVLSITPSPGSSDPPVRGGDVRVVPAVFGQMEERGSKKEEDTHFIQILKNVQEVINGWLKSINGRIEKEDVTGLEVRFLEILRNVLEWVKGKIDAKIESSKGQKEESSGSGRLRDAYLWFSPQFVTG